MDLAVKLLRFFFASLIIFEYKDTKGLAMINKAATPLQITVKPS
jgi:hypothetical protein